MSKTPEKLKPVKDKIARASALGALPLSVMAMTLPVSRAEAAPTPKNAQPSLVAMAREIWQQDGRPSPHRHVKLMGYLPGGEWTEMAMSSTSTNPKNVTSINVLVSDPQQKQEPGHMIPSIKYSFTKHDGSWTAVQRITNPEMDSTSVITEKNGTVVTDTRSFVGDKTLGAEELTEVHNGKVANEVLHNFVVDATAIVGKVAISQPVSLSDLR